MLAEHPDLNVDAACQVAHALSTHRVSMEMDFFTAVDDLEKKDNAGASMMGFTGFNSACFYRYACISWDQLIKNLNNNAQTAKKTVEGFLQASLDAMPTGKQTSFAANNPPAFAMVVMKKHGAAWSLANAFAKPVSPSNNSSLIQTSVSALVDYWGKLVKVYGGQSIEAKPALALDDGIDFTGLDRVESLEQLIDQVKKAIAFHR
jgi:CRISPR system Cascade subunit CasC